MEKKKERKNRGGRNLVSKTYVQHPPMQIPPQKLLDLPHLQAPQAHAANLLLAPPVRHERSRQRDDVAVHQAALVLRAAVVAVLEAARREDAVDADEARLVVPRARVWVEVAEEEQDLEGAIECESATKVGTKRLVMWLWGKGGGIGLGIFFYFLTLIVAFQCINVLFLISPFRCLYRFCAGLPPPSLRLKHLPNSRRIAPAELTTPRP
jgi:hypothetical protein